MDHDKKPPPIQSANGDRPWQFSLRSLILLFVVVAVVCLPLAYLGSYGIAGSLILGGIVLLVVLRRKQMATVVELLVIAGIMLIVVAMFLPPMDTGTTSAQGVTCQNNLRTLTQALHFYHQDQGTFPPAYIADETGKPMHSWRVLILPYLDEKQLYEQYRFDEPWDGPNNILLHNRMPTVFQCPCARVGATAVTQQYTSYLAVVGEETAWPGTERTTLDEIAAGDGTADTILLVEVANSGVHWMEPRDLTMATTSALINQGPPGQAISSGHAGGANVAFADCSIHFLPQTTPGKQVQAMLTIDGKEVLDRNEP